jgi:hypothetical protein
MMMKNDVQELLRRHRSMLQKRDPWMSYWQQLCDVLLPNQADFTSKGQSGQQRGANIYDGTPRLAARDLGTTVDGLIKPKSSSWFDVIIEDEDLMEYEEAKVWLDVCKDRMWSSIYHPDARFIQRSGEVDLNLVVMGWGALWISENNKRNGLLFRSFHNSQVAYDENEEGIVDTMTVLEKLSARQAAEHYKKYGVDLPRRIKDELERKTTGEAKTFEFAQLVVPNGDYDQRLISIEGKQFVSCLIDIEEEAVVAKGGFHEFPAAIPRWETAPGEVYPRSPGMIALPDARTLQSMGKTLLIGGQRAVDPPIWVQNDAVVSPIRTFPGGITILDMHDSTSTPIGALPVANNLPIGREMQRDYRMQVEAAFFKNVFNLPIEGRQMTATEIVARKEEFIRVIGPVFGRLESDYIGHIAKRVFGIMERAGAFPPKPDILKGVKVNFRFQSPIQKARKQMEIANLSQSLQFIAPLAETQPEILDHIDGDEIMKDAPEWGGLPQKWMRAQDKIKQLRAGRAEAQQMQTQLAASGPLSQAIKNVADASSVVSEEPVATPY